MHVTIRHETVYQFSGEVFLEPHLIRLTPRHDGAQQLEHFSLRIDPVPAGRTDMLDACGNRVLRAWFSGACRELTILSRSTVRTLRANPFDYLLEPEAQALPSGPDSPREHLLAPYLTMHCGSGTAELTRTLLRACNRDTLDFLNSLTAWIYGNIRIAPRTQPGTRTAEETLQLRHGACRDATVLFMAACRHVGLPARYVSGYAPGDPDAEHDLHAWPEVYLPGAGWRGYDPTQGLTVADRHIALCAAPTPELTAPVDGTFRGSGVTARLQHAIVITTRA